MTKREIEMTKINYLAAELTRYYKRNIHFAAKLRGSRLRQIKIEMMKSIIVTNLFIWQPA
jgi:hypothetical protein